MTSASLHFEPKDYKSDLKPVWCPGCGDFGVLSALYKAMSLCDLDPACTVIVSGIGCSSRLPGFVKTYGFHSVHGRVLPVATGIKAARPDLNVIAVGGDGDAYAIGGGHLPHCARRNPDITYLVMNNNVYGLTKGQVSPTSMLPHATQSPRIDPKRWRTTPYGTIEHTLDPIAQAIAWDLSFVARGFSYKPTQLTDLMVQALKHKGFSLLDIFSPCPTNNLDQTEEYYKDHTFDVPADHDHASRVQAFALSLHADGFPIGVIYKNEGKPTLADELQAIRHHFSGESSASLAGLFRKFQ